MAEKYWNNFSFGANSLREDPNSLNMASVGAVTPQYIIKCEDFFISDMVGYENNAVPCLWLKLGGRRNCTYDAGGTLSGDGVISFESTAVAIKFCAGAPIVQQYMYQGVNIALISLIRFSNINKNMEIIHQIDYTNCKIERYEQEGDIVTFSFNFTKVLDTNTKFKLDGSKDGVTATEFDVSKIVTTAK